MGPCRRRCQRQRAVLRQLCAALLLFAHSASAISIEGLLPQAEVQHGMYVGKFCYDYSMEPDKNIGLLSVSTTRFGPPPSGGGRFYFLIYDDERKHWRNIRKNWATATCEEKRRDASLAMLVHVEDPLSPHQEFTINIREHIRPRFWYFAFIACDGMDISESHVRFHLHGTNNFWGYQQEFSLDHMGLLTTYVVFTFCFALVAFCTFRCAHRQIDGQASTMKEHPYVQLLMLSIVMSALSCLFFLVHYYFFVQNGFGSMRIRFLGVCAGIVANCTMYLLAILTSCGWAISSFELPSRQLFLGMISAVGLLNLLCELHAELMVDQSTQLYSYSGLGGVFTLMLKVFMFCWFAFQTKTSYDEEHVEKRRTFYKVLGVSISAWSMCVPITVVCALAVAPWYRFKVVTIVDLVARFLGLCVFSQLFFGPLSPITAQNTFVLQDDGVEGGSFASMT